MSDVKATVAMTAKDAASTFESAGKAAKAFRSAGRSVWGIGVHLNTEAWPRASVDSEVFGPLMTSFFGIQGASMSGSVPPQEAGLAS